MRSIPGTRALYSLGVHAFKRGQLAEALSTLQAAHAVAPRDPVVLLSIAMVLREQGDSAGELRAIDAALAADPYFLAGLLAKAAHLERQGRTRAAAVYRNALKVAPPEPHWPASLQDQLQHGRALVQRVGNALAAFLAERTGSRLSALTPTEAQRWREAGAILSGHAHPYPSVCSQSRCRACRPSPSTSATPSLGSRRSRPAPRPAPRS